MIIQRRNFLIGLASSLAAPAIVRANSLMPVKALPTSKVEIIDDLFLMNGPLFIYGFFHIRPEWMNEIVYEITGLNNV